MARTRNIKPSFFTNDELAECSFPARLLFAGLWTLADRAGRLLDKPRRIKGQLFPFDDLDIEALLVELVERGFVSRYAVGKVQVISIPNFVKHQRPHPHEPESELPAEDTTNRDMSLHDTASRDKVRSSCALPSSNPSTLPPSNPSVAETAEKPSSAKPVPKAATAEVPLLEFPCDGSPRSWALYEELHRELSESFPSLDVLAEARKALAWVNASPERRKTFRGMRKFLVGWLSRAQDRGGGYQSRAGPDSRTTRRGIDVKSLDLEKYQ